MNKHSFILDSKAVSVINKMMEAILVASSTIIIVLVTFYVIIRYFTPINFIGFEEIVILLVVWLYFIGSANASREKSHIAADMMELFVKKESVRQRIKLFSQIVGFAVLVIMLYLSIDYLKFNAEYNTRTIIYRWPMYIYHASLVMGFILMLFYDTCHLAKTVSGMRQAKALQAPAPDGSAKEGLS